MVKPSLLYLFLQINYDDQIKLKRECEDWKSENSCVENGERRPSNSAKFISLIKRLRVKVKLEK
jgi:hypothetical protein